VTQYTKTLAPNYHWNFFAFLTDYVCFSVAFSFISVSSVLPALVGQLSDSAPVIGLVNTVYIGGWLLPQLAVARLINDKPRKRPYMLVGLSCRVLFWVIALGLWAGLASYPTAMLILFFTCLGLFAIFDGFTSVSWFDILARAIPLQQRGRLSGIAQFISGLIGVGVGGLVSVILGRYTFPNNYALLLTLAGIALIPSTIALILIREPPPKTDRDAPDSMTRDKWCQILANPHFCRLIGSRLLIGSMGLATSFYVLHAERVLRLPPQVIGQFVSAETLARIVGSLILGLVGERWGPRYVARIGSAVAALGPLFALIVHLTQAEWLIPAYPLVYVALGIINSTWMMGFTNYMLEIAPEHMRSAYVGLGNTILGALTLMPMIGGWLLEATSYTTLFGLSATVITLGFLLTLGLKPAQEVVQQSNA